MRAPKSAKTAPETGGDVWPRYNLHPYETCTGIAQTVISSILKKNLIRQIKFFFKIAQNDVPMQRNRCLRVCTKTTFYRLSAQNQPNMGPISPKLAPKTLRKNLLSLVVEQNTTRTQKKIRASRHLYQARATNSFSNSCHFSLSFAAVCQTQRGAPSRSKKKVSRSLSKRLQG